MKNDKKDFTVFERVMVVAILLFVAAIAIQDLVHSVRASEEDSVHAASKDYSAMRNMYAEQLRAAAGGASGVYSTSAASIFSSPAH